MAEKKDVKIKKQSASTAGKALDGVAWGIRQIALPIPDFLFKKKKKK